MGYGKRGGEGGLGFVVKCRFVSKAIPGNGVNPTLLLHLRRKTKVKNWKLVVVDRVFFSFFPPLLFSFILPISLLY